MKIDAVPGIITHIRVTPRKVGSYPIVCAELCGLGHAFMRNTAHVMDKQAFATWLRRHSALQSAAGGPAAGGPAAPPPSTTAATPAMIAAGKTVFTGASGCSGCHTLADAGANGQIGPDLDKVLANRDQKFIQTSIVDPNAFIEKGFTKGVMPPNFGTMLSKDDLSNVVAYLYSVTHK
jgi:cytochrome c oxidase subunit 2